jgi:hypothetical protein
MLSGRYSSGRLKVISLNRFAQASFVSSPATLAGSSPLSGVFLAHRPSYLIAHLNETIFA